MPATGRARPRSRELAQLAGARRVHTGSHRMLNTRSWSRGGERRSRGYPGADVSGVDSAAPANRERLIPSLIRSRTVTVSPPSMATGHVAFLKSKLSRERRTNRRLRSLIEEMREEIERSRHDLDLQMKRMAQIQASEMWLLERAPRFTWSLNGPIRCVTGTRSIQFPVGAVEHPCAGIDRRARACQSGQTLRCRPRLPTGRIRHHCLR